jgi:hypothetical protein
MKRLVALLLVPQFQTVTHSPIGDGLTNAATAKTTSGSTIFVNEFMGNAFGAKL